MEPSLVERARDGDLGAFEALIRPEVQGMARVAMAIIGDESEAREALQEALTTMWRELPALRDPDRFAAWSGRILINRCRLTLRRRRRHERHEVSLDAAAVSGSAVGRGPEATALERNALEAAFERLDSDARTLLVLHHLSGLPLAEIAERLDVPTGTVKSRLHAARRALERELEAEA